eukprot:NODE_5489_length_941_cov_112.635697_g5267_i0.p1 GENE.NODE_5489_length_941_cov_112.635697_g5267_i0~~NODE_5489_length_941_cov_112.635697_g5267_i0.p1  ORF type:complete len:239 (+),score=30.37 NODE_5489_length_941_cov_112.635697_g5267_i0:71-787(+)
MEGEVAKIQAQIETVAPGTTVAIVVLSGSLNPVHTMHVKALEVSKHTIETKLGLQVVGGYLVPSSDNYVTGKLGPDAMKLKHRVDMAALACQDIPWITTSDCGIARASDIVSMLVERLSARFPLHKFKGFMMYGADFVEKYSAWGRMHHVPVICIGRPGHTQVVRDAIDRLRAGGAPSLFGFDVNGVVLADEELEDISSTKIRQLLALEQFDKLVSNGWVVQPVAEYLRFRIKTKGSI